MTAAPENMHSGNGLKDIIWNLSDDIIELELNFPYMHEKSVGMSEYHTISIFSTKDISICHNLS